MTVAVVAAAATLDEDDDDEEDEDEEDEDEDEEEEEDEDDASETPCASSVTRCRMASRTSSLAVCCPYAPRAVVRTTVLAAAATDKAALFGLPPQGLPPRGGRAGS